MGDLSIRRLVEMKVELSPEEAKKLITILAIFLQEGKSIIIEQSSASGIGTNTYVKVDEGNEIDITDYGVW
jgi:hypothetical protein